MEVFIDRAVGHGSGPGPSRRENLGTARGAIDRGRVRLGPDAEPDPELMIPFVADELCMNCVQNMGPLDLTSFDVSDSECEDLDFCECHGLETRVDPISTVLNRPCYQVGIVNMGGALLEDVTVEICDVQGCQSYPAHWPAWEPGSLISLPVQAVVYDQGDMMSTVVPEVRVYSGGEQVSWKEWPRFEPEQEPTGN